MNIRILTALLGGLVLASLAKAADPEAWPKYNKSCRNRRA